MKKHGLAKFGQLLGNLSAGKIEDYPYVRRQAEPWQLSPNSRWILNNVHIVDVDKGTIYNEKAIMINGSRFGNRLNPADVESASKSGEVEEVLDGANAYLIPGMSDIHCHLSLISEYKLKLSGLHYFDAQRMKNCEFAISKGCTTVRDSGGAYDMVFGLKTEIDNNQLLGPRILPSYTVLSSPGGMWDINIAVNKMSEMIFGGKILNFPKTLSGIRHNIEDVIAKGADSIKIYLEDKPLYGGQEDKVYTMFPDDQIKYIRNIATEHGKVLESHAMFIKGAKKSIRGKVDSIAHLTVDAPYTFEDADTMARENIAIVPTFGVGSYLAMDCGSNGFPENEEYQFFRSMLSKYVRPNMERATVPQLKQSYLDFYEFIQAEVTDRKMPDVGKVHPERCHGFGVYAPETMKNLKKAGTRIGIGTDGGTGTCFAGALEIEFESYLRYGFSPKEILRMTTLGNMEIMQRNDQLGSIAEGKLADMVLLETNPLDNIMAATSPVKVFKTGRCLLSNGKNI